MRSYFSLLRREFNFFLKKLNFLLNNEKYDLIVASTSPILDIICYYYSRKYKTKILCDLQDSYDVYDEYKIPFIKHMDKYIIKNSDMVICVSQTLKNRIKKFRNKPTFVIENGIEKNLFKPLDKIKCRKSLKLPLDSKIIVYIGHIAKLKGFNVLLGAFNIVRKKFPNSYLIISGQIDKDVSIKHKNVIFNPLPKRNQVVMAINAGDVAVIPNLKNDFTEYCFPYKLAEYMACQVPIVATNVGDVGLILKKYKGSLCQPDDADGLAKKIIVKLKNYERIDYSQDLKNFDWKILAENLNNIMNDFLIK